MLVFSPLSLYTTYLGWQQYDVIFQALWQTGLLYLGFLMIAFRYLKNVLAPAGSTHHAGDHALNTFLYELAITFLICAVFVYPCVPLEEKALQFKPLCGMKSDATKVSTLRDTGTTYDEAFAHVLTPHVKIPIGFAILQNYLSSLTYGLMKVTGCTDSLQAIEGDVVSTYLPDDIRKQATNFHQQCFLEARNRYEAEPHNTPKIKDLLKRFGEDDLNGMGSKIFQTLYYSDIHARQPVSGFSFREAPNPHFQNAAKRGDIAPEHVPQLGYPSCNQWWGKLQRDLVEVANHASIFDSHLNYVSLLERVRNYKQKHPKAWGSPISSEEYIAKMMLNDSRGVQANSMSTLISNSNGNVSSTIAHTLVNVGQWAKSQVSTPLKREAIMQTLPVMQAFLYFFMIILTPVILAFSGYSPKALGSLCGLFIMTIFIQYLWHLVGFIERSVLDPLGKNEAISAMRNMAVLFYFIAPMLLLRLSSHFGGEAGSALMGLLSQSEEHSNAVVHSAEQLPLQAAKLASRKIL